MKSTDIPNGFVVVSPTGKPALLDFDDDGKTNPDSYSELSVTAWMTNFIKDGRFPPELLILVHTVKGEGQMLIKALEANRMVSNGEPIGVEQVASKGCLKTFAEKIRADYMEKLSAKV